MKRIMLCVGLMLLLTGCKEQEHAVTELDALPPVVIEVNNETQDLMIEDETETSEMEWTPRQPLSEMDFIQAKGKALYTQYGQGEAIQLRGVNVGGYLLQEFWMTPTRASDQIQAELDLITHLEENFGEDGMRELLQVYQEAYFSESDFDRLAEMGMNVIRLPFWYRNFVRADGTFYEDWHERLDWFVAEAGKRGLYVILDFHGAPGSQNGSDHSGVDGGEDKEGASEFFFGDPKTVATNQELYYVIWEKLAEHFKDNPVIAGYDLLNEPYCTYRYSTNRPVLELHNTLFEVYDEAYRRIRAIDPDHMILMSATWDPSDLPNPNDYGWTNVMYQYHNYLYDDYDNAQGNQIRNMNKKIQLIQTANYNVPSFMGEFAYFNSLDAWDEGLELLNAAGLHWASWTYKVVPHYGNWGLYHHTIMSQNIENQSYETIAAFFKQVGDVKPNTGLIGIMEKHLKRKE